MPILKPASAAGMADLAELRVGVLFNDDRALAVGEAQDAAAVAAVADCAEAVVQACRENGWQAERIPATRDPRLLLARLEAARPDVVFNLMEGLDGDPHLEPAAAWLLELTGLPYTGSPPRAMQLALEKPVTRAVLAAAGVPVPAGRVLARGDEPLDDLHLPVIVKPSAEDASHGITLDSVVHTVAAARARAAYVRDAYRQPALVEEFVAGREFNVSVLGAGDACEALPLAEIDFTADWPAGSPQLVTYVSKWGPEEAPEYRGSRTIPARALPPGLAERIRATAIAAYRAIGLRDYGRVDLRVHPERGPFVIDVNPNPDISPCAGLNIAADLAGLTYAQLVARVVTSALERAHAHPAPRRG